MVFIISSRTRLLSCVKLASECALASCSCVLVHCALGSCLINACDNSAESLSRAIACCNGRLKLLDLGLYGRFDSAVVGISGLSNQYTLFS